MTTQLQLRLFAYVGGILRSEGCVLAAAGGMPDHIHFLVSLDKQKSISEIVRIIKANSSKWVHETFPEFSRFAWQVGYGAFSVSFSHIDRVKEYLSRQAEHHRTQTFQEEYLAFLQRHGMEYDERYLWD